MFGAVDGTVASSYDERNRKQQRGGVTLLLPDIVWNGTVVDFAVSAGSDDVPTGSLTAPPLRTDVILLLFTDARAGTYKHHGDRRGWLGDGFDVDFSKGKAPLGSKLWLYR